MKTPEWRPIEDARRDGEYIWVFDEMPSDDYGPDIFLACWNHRANEGFGRWEAHPDVETDPYDIDPTHYVVFYDETVGCRIHASN